MENPQKTSHWKSLAEILGAAAEEGAQEGAAQAAEPVAQPIVPLPKPPAAQLPPPPKQATVRQAKADWEALASVLGLSSKPASSSTAEVQQEAAGPPIPEPTYSPPVSSEPVELAAAHWDAPLTTSTDSVDPLEMSTEPFIDDVVDAVELDVVAESESEVVSDAASEERRRRRRRRRRRGRRPEESEHRKEPPPTRSLDESEDRLDEPEDRLDDPEDRLDEPEDRLDEPEDRERDDEADDELDRSEPPSEVSRRKESDEDSDRPRRRRRRRRRTGRREEGGATSSPSRAAPEEEDDSVEDEDTLAELLRDDDSAEDERGDEPQLSHKKIPSWQEAIEVVVTANMAQRAKHPSSGQRGGRGRR